MLCRITYKWVKSFKNGPSEICGRQTLKNLVCIADHITSNFLKGCLPQMLLGPFLNTLTQNILPPDLFVKNENNCQIK